MRLYVIAVGISRSAAGQGRDDDDRPGLAIGPGLWST